MVAFKRIHCTVVEVSENKIRSLSRGAIAREILPWADPYVAQLIKNLQEEVRSERRKRSHVRHRTLGVDGASASTSWRISATR